MVKPQVCCNEKEIRQLLKEYLQELMSKKQEVLIAWRRACIAPVRCIIRGYEPPQPEGEYADALFIHELGSVCVVITTPGEITRFEVLPTQQMDNKLAYKQITEMEHAAGLDRK